MRALARGGSGEKPAARARAAPAAPSPTPDTPPPPSTSPASAPARGAAAKQPSATPSKQRSTTPAAGPRRGRTPPTGTLPLVLAPGALTSAARAAVVELPPGVDPGPGSGAVGRVADAGATLDLAGVLCDARPFARAGTLMAVALTSAGGVPSARVDGVWTRAVAAVPRAGQVEGGGRHVAALEASDDSDAPRAASTPRSAKGRGRGRGKKAAVKKKRVVKPKAVGKKKAAPKKAAPKKARK